MFIVCCGLLESWEKYYIRPLWGRSKVGVCAASSFASLSRMRLSIVRPL